MRRHIAHSMLIAIALLSSGCLHTGRALLPPPGNGAFPRTHDMLDSYEHFSCGPDVMPLVAPFVLLEAPFALTTDVINKVTQ